MRALNDIVPETPVILVTRMGAGVRVLQDSRENTAPQLAYRRVGPLIGQILPDREGGFPVLVEPPVTLPPSPTDVVKWPNQKPLRENSHPLADHLSLRDLNATH